MIRKGKGIPSLAGLLAPKMLSSSTHLVVALEVKLLLMDVTWWGTTECAGGLGRRHCLPVRDAMNTLPTECLEDTLQMSL